MLTRYMGITPQSQSYLFTFGLALTLLGMVLTDMWLPMVAGAMIMTGLAVEAWIRVAHIIPMRKDIRALQQQLDYLQIKSRNE
ncbi:NADH dehydrogenase subunit II-related protein [Vibrio chagasii]|nr:NADH dehydrogenase subunit II-related protein [Vibrio chagasii]